MNSSTMDLSTMIYGFEKSWVHVWKAYERKVCDWRVRGVFMVKEFMVEILWLKSLCSESSWLKSSRLKSSWLSHLSHFMYRKVPTITSSLYILNPLFEGQKCFFKSFFQKILPLCMISFQEWFIIKSGLWWGTYSIM